MNGEHHKRFVVSQEDVDIIFSTKQKFYVFQVEVPDAVDLLRKMDYMKPIDCGRLVKELGDRRGFISSADDSDENDDGYNSWASEEIEIPESERLKTLEHRTVVTELKTPPSKSRSADDTSSDSKDGEFDLLFSYERQMGPRGPKPQFSPVPIFDPSNAMDMNMVRDGKSDECN